MQNKTTRNSPSKIFRFPISPYNLLLLQMAAFLALAETPDPRANPDSDGGPSLEQQVDALFAEWDKPNSPGCAVVIVKDGKVIHHRGYGMANLEHDIPITSSTVFDTASVSKQFTGLAAAILVQQGKLSLDAGLLGHLPDFPDLGKPITVRHLVHHTSGLRDWPGLFAVRGKSFEDLISFNEILGMARRQRELNFEPGAEFLYSNTGYNLLAKIVEQVTGQSFSRWTEKNIFKPLGMSRTHFHDDHQRIVKGRASSYQLKAGGGWANVGNQLTALGSSSMYSTTEDLARWLINLQNAQLYPEALTLIRQQGALNDGTPIEYAFGLGLSKYRGLNVEQHTGSWAGFRTILAHYPGQQFGLAILGNATSLNTVSLARKITEIYLEERLEALPEKRDPPASSPAEFVIQEAHRNNYLGKYSMTEGPLVELVHENNQFLARAGELGFVLEPQSPTEFLNRLTGERLLIELNEEGKAHRILRLTETGPVLIATRVADSEVERISLKAYGGSYESAELEVTYHLEIEEGQLIARGPQGNLIRLAMKAPDQFAGNAWYFSQAQFFRNDQDEISGFTVSSGRVRHLRFQRLPNEPAISPENEIQQLD